MKAAAPLTSSLMARKGSAVPAEMSVVPLKPAMFVKPRSRPPEAQPGPVRHAGEDGTCTAKAGPHRAAKLTLRLDGDQHLQVKLLASHLNCSIQTIIREALQRHLDEMVPHYLRGKCACLAELGLAHPPSDETEDR